MSDITQYNGKDPYEIVLVQVWKLILLHNRMSLNGIAKDDMQEIAANLRQEYSLEEVQTARDEFKLSVNSSITLGTFLEKCLALRRSNERIESTQQIFKANTRGKRLAVTKFGELKDVLEKFVKPLPYNKNFRVNDKTERMDCIELRDHLDVVRSEQHAEMVSCGNAIDFESINNPQLKSLYKKAWTVGITNEEKELISTLQQR